MKRVTVNTKRWDATGLSWDNRRKSLYTLIAEYDVRNGTSVRIEALKHWQAINEASRLEGQERRRALRAVFKNIGVDLRFE